MLIIDNNTFALNAKNEIKDENGNLKYWSQPDFSYKQRVHVYDNQDNEIGYVQYKILSSQEHINFFDYTDKEIDMADLTQINKQSKWNYQIARNDVICEVKEDNNKVLIDIKDSNLVDKCILFIFSLAQ